MNIGIIGFGAIGAVHAKVIRALEGANLTAVAVRSAEKAGKAAEEFGCAAYTDYREMLKRKDIDMAVVWGFIVVFFALAALGFRKMRAKAA